MTIAIGMTARDGVVVAADTQETIQGYWKVDQGKVQACFHADVSGLKGACLVSAAGTSGGYCDAIMQQLTRTFLGNKNIVTTDEIEAMFKREVEAFHRDHVGPFAGPDRPVVDTIIAASRNGHSGLWATDKSTTTKYPHYTAVGIGGSHADGLLAKLWHYDQNVVAMAILAAYIVWHVKEHVDGCGKSTEVLFIHRDTIFQIRRDEADGLDRIFASYSDDVEPIAMQHVVGFEDRFGNRTFAAPSLRQTRKELDKFHRLLVARIEGRESKLMPLVRKPLGPATARVRRGSKHGR